MLAVRAVLVCLLAGCSAIAERSSANDVAHSSRVNAKHHLAQFATHGHAERMFRRDLTGTADKNECIGCLSDDGTGNPVTLRIFFLEGPDMVENSVAMEAAEQAGTKYDCGSCCSDPNRAHPECFVAENWNSGWIAKPTLRTLVQTGARLVAMTAANLTDEAASLSTDTEPYALCPLEVVLGNVDLCVGDWWETLERRTQVQFSTPLRINHFKLITVEREQAGFESETLLEMLRPFSAGVWCAIFGMFAFAGLLFWVLNEACEDFDEAEVFPGPKGMTKAIWVASMGYFAGNQFEVMSWPARIVLLGYSFFLATVIAAYTANLASFMVQQREEVGLVSSLNDIVMRGKTLCLVPGVANMLTEPGILERSVVMTAGSMASMFEMLYLGLCDASLVGENEYLLYVQAGNVQYDICTTESDPNYGGGFFCLDEGSELTRYDLTKCQCGTEAPFDVPAEECPSSCVAPHTKFCNVIEVLDPTLRVSLNYALPIADWLEPFFSAGIIASKIVGHFAVDYREELTDKNPPACPAGSAQQRFSQDMSSNAGARSLSVQQMAGTFLISVVLMVLGLLFQLWDTWRQHLASKVTPEDAEHASFVEQDTKKRSEWEANASRKRQSASPDPSCHTTKIVIGHEDSTAAASQAATAAPGSPMSRPPVIAADNADLLQSDLDFEASESSGPAGGTRTDQLEAAESHAEVPVVGVTSVGWAEAQRLEEATKGMVEREAENAAIRQALDKLSKELRILQQGGVGAPAWASSNKGGSFRRRAAR